MKHPQTSREFAKRSRQGGVVGVLVLLGGIFFALESQNTIGLVSAILLAVCGAAFSAMMFIASRRWSKL